MYALVKEILDTSKERDVDILVARDMIVADGKEYKEVNAAYEIIHRFYKVITLLRKKNNEANIKKICALCAEGKEDELRAFVEGIKEANNIK